MNCKECGRSFKKERSNQQNKYYWGVVVETLSTHIGYTKEEMHDILKHKFLRQLVSIPNKTGYEEIEITRSTTELDTKEWEEFMSKVREWASINLACWIPEPHEVVGSNA